MNRLYFFHLIFKNEKKKKSHRQQSCRNKFKEICFQPTNFPKIWFWYQKSPISDMFNIFHHVSIMMAPSGLIMASLSMLSHFLPSSIPPPPFPHGVWNGWTTRGVVFALCGRYFHSPTDTKELLYDPASVMNGDTLKFCLKEAWCKLSFFVLSFFYYLYWWVVHSSLRVGRVIIGLHVKRLH